MLCAPLVKLIGGHEDHDVGEGTRNSMVVLAKEPDLLGVVVGRRHAGELWPVIKGRAVVEDDRGERAGELGGRRGRQRGGFDDRSQGVTLAATLHAEQADRVGLVEVERDRPAECFRAQDAVLGGRVVRPEEDLRRSSIGRAGAFRRGWLGHCDGISVVAF
jgi:hypothetical protein